MNKAVLISNILIITSAVSIPIALTDQYLHFAKLPKDNARIMLLSGGRLDSSHLGIRRYTPNSHLRQSAVYGNTLEYTYTFKTDKNGFRVTSQCGAANPVDNFVAIAGDSFTEGQGSNASWTEAIQKQLCDQGHGSINTSIAGYGIEDMKYALDFTYEELGSRKAIVAIIDDDIYRPRTLMTSNVNCSMYESRWCGDSATWWHHPEGLTPEDLITFANSKYDFGIIAVLRVLKRQFMSSLMRLTNKNNDIRQSKMINRSISAMNSIISRYGAMNVSLIILPTKNTRGLEGSPEEKVRRSRDLQIFLDSIHKNISVSDLRDCPLDAQHFFPIDGHPNEKGHKQLGICSSQ